MLRDIIGNQVLTIAQLTSDLEGVRGQFDLLKQELAATRVELNEAMRSLQALRSE